MFGISGFFAGIAASVDLPAAAFVVGLALILGFRSLTRTLLFFVPLAMIPIASLLITNFIAIGDIRPAYAKQSWYEFEGSYWKEGMRTGIDSASQHDD